MPRFFDENLIREGRKKEGFFDENKTRGVRSVMA